MHFVLILSTLAVSVLGDTPCTHEGGVCMLASQCSGEIRYDLCSSQENECCLPAENRTSAAPHDDSCLDCYCQILSGCHKIPCMDIGSSRACGFFLIGLAYYKDCGQPGRNNEEPVDTAWERCASNYTCSVLCIQKYAERYSYKCPGLSACELAVRLHYGGPDGCNRSSPNFLKGQPYWDYVSQCQKNKSNKTPTATSPIIPVSVAVSAAVLVAIFLCVSIYLYRLYAYTALPWNRKAAYLTIDMRQITLFEELGEGSFGKVYRGRWRKQDVAVKKFFKANDESELNNLKRVKHLHIVTLYGVSNHDGMYLVMELMNCGSLGKLLHSAKHILFTVDYAISWAHQTADAVAYLHSVRILHRDLKPTNLLLHDHYRLLKIGDFGTATDLRTTMTHTCGTLAYMAPEARSTKYDEKCDVYSFGICLHEIFSRKKPFEDMSDCKVIYQVAAMDKRPDPIDGLPPRIVLLMNSCWHSDVQQRPQMRQVFETLTELVKEHPHNSQPLYDPKACQAPNMKKHIQIANNIRNRLSLCFGLQPNQNLRAVRWSRSPFPPSEPSEPSEPSKQSEPSD